MVKKEKEETKNTDIPEDSLKEEALEEAAEKESLDTTELEAKKKKLLEKAKKLVGKVETTTTEDLKAQIKIKKRTDMLVPLEEYVKNGIYLGTRVVTPDMKPFIYRRRADGLAIFNTDLIDEKLKEAIDFLVKFDAKEIVLVCRRQAGWRAADMMSKLTGIKVFTKKYPAGILTNTNLRDFFENELTIVCDSWLDKNSLHDTLRVKKKVLMVCDTNNHANGADKIIIGNNKSPRSLGLIFYLLTRGYLKAKELSTEGMPDIDWWTEEAEAGVSSESGAKFGV